MRWALLKRIDALEPGREARGAARFEGTLPLFADHFPGFPVVPGVLLIESVAQLAGKLIEVTVKRDTGVWPFPVLSMVERTKFRRFCAPDEELELQVTLRELRPESAVVRGRVVVQGQRRADMQLLFVFDPDGVPRTVEGVDLETFERRAIEALGVTRLDALLNPETSS